MNKSMSYTVLLTAGLAMAVTWTAAHGEDPAGSSTQDEPPVYDQWFTDQAMRVDLFHTGDGENAGYSLDEVVREPLWPGTRKHLIDPFGRGTSRYRVSDLQTGKEIFRLGFATLFGEWTGTPEALGGVKRSMSESVRFPCPRKPVLVTIEERNDRGGFDEVFELAVDPRSHLIRRAVEFPDAEVMDLGGGPDPAEALDVVIVPDGYTRRERAKLRTDLTRFARVLLTYEPYAGNHDRIHVRGVLAFSHHSGPSEPRKGIFRDTVLGTSFNTFDSPRYLTVTHTKRLRQLAARAPYDAIFVMVNTARYGGGGVYNQWAIFPSDNEYDEYVMLHEFGHSMAGLGDEYYSSAVSTDEDLMYPGGVEPWEPNITAMLGGKRGNVKWNHMIDPSTPVPTPEEEKWSDVVGAFEGAGYKAKGLYRPQMDCKMFHKGMVGFCKVCQEAIVDMMRYYASEELP